MKITSNLVVFLCLKRKLLLTMKLTSVLILIGVMQVSAGAFAQHNISELRAENKSVREIFKLIETKSNFRFFYNEDFADLNKVLSINVKNKQLEEILGMVFSKSNVTYRVLENNLVVITPDGTLRNKISGRIIDAATGDPLPGVSVTVEGTSKGTVTDAQGRYTIDAADDNVLVFSFMGYLAQKVTPGGRAVIDIKLEQDTKKLDEIIVVGYGTTKKSDLTGSVVSLKAEDLEKTVVTNPTQMLAGRASGVQVMQTSAAPGGRVSIQVRGGNSISSSNEPLYVVDGFPMASLDANQLNPGDIASMEVLKDASATAIYGARGANGVVIISTKKGSQGTRITYDAYYGINKLSKKIPLIGAQDFMGLMNAKAAANGQPAVFSPDQMKKVLEEVGPQGTDWQQEILRTGQTQSHQISIATGSENTKVYLSGNYFNQKGIISNTDFKRYTGNLSVEQKVGERFKSGVNVRGYRTDAKKRGFDGSIVESNIMYNILRYDPTVPIRNADGSYGRSRLPKYGNNPLVYVNEPTDDESNIGFHADANASYEIIKGLSAKINAGYDYNSYTEGKYTPKTVPGSIGSADKRNNGNTRGLVEAFLNYDRSFGQQHRLGVLAGYSYQKDQFDELYGASSDFATDYYLYNNLNAGNTKTDLQSLRTESVLNSYFGRVNYAYKDRYLFTGTLRADGSSRFGKNNKFGYFPSASLAWRMSEEDFIKSLGVFSNLKIRTSYGLTGNDRINNYSSLARMDIYPVSTDGITASKGLAPANLLNPDLKWESTSQFDVGLDMGFFDNRLNVTADYYYKKTNDLLQNVPTSRVTGFNSVLLNSGTLENKGVELSIESVNTTGALKWNTAFNISYNKNKVISLGDRDKIIQGGNKPDGSAAYMDFSILRPGLALSSIYGYIWEGIIQAGEKYAPQPNSVPGDPKFRDVDGNGIIDANDRTVIGNGNPDFFFGLTNDFKYKNWDLTVFFQGSVGNDLYNVNRLVLEENRSYDALNFWRADKPSTEVPRNGYYSLTYGGYVNSHFVENASYLRCKNIVLGYTFPVKNWGKSIHSLRVYVNAQNLFTVTNYTGFDPEVGTDTTPTVTNGATSYQTGNLGRGKDFNAYPASRIFMAGVRLGF